MINSKPINVEEESDEDIDIGLEEDEEPKVKGKLQNYQQSGKYDEEDSEDSILKFHYRFK